MTMHVARGKVKFSYPFCKNVESIGYKEYQRKIHDNLVEARTCV
jgi:hypothetical protein